MVRISTLPCLTSSAAAWQCFVPDPFEHETQAISTTGSACVGGDGGGDFGFHRKGQHIKSIHCWGYGGDNDGFTKLAVTYSDGTDGGDWTGNGRKEVMPFTFEDGWVFDGDIAVCGNGKGTGVGCLMFNMRRLNDTGSRKSFSCGHAEIRDHVKFPADGQILAGLYGRGGSSQINSLGLLLKSPDADCPVIKTEIVGVECKNRQSGNKCEASFAEEKEGFELVQFIGECGPHNDLTSGGTFTYANAREISSESTSIDQLGTDVGVSGTFGVDFDGVFKEETTMSVHVTYSHTWQKSKSQSDTSTSTIAADCSSTAHSGQRIKLTDTVAIGTLTADMIYHVKTTKKCGSAPETKSHEGKVTIKNVPILKATGDCKNPDVCANPSPSPSPSPTPSPSPEPTPSPAPAPSPEPTPSPTPSPSPEPTPSPSPEPTPSPSPEPSPTPSPEPTPSPSPEPSPAPTPEPAPEPTPSPEPDCPHGSLNDCIDHCDMNDSKIYKVCVESCQRRCGGGDEPDVDPTTQAPSTPTTLPPVSPTTPAPPAPPADPTQPPTNPPVDPTQVPTTPPVDPTTQPPVEPTQPPTNPPVDPTTPPVDPTTQPPVEPTLPPTIPPVDPTQAPTTVPVEPTTQAPPAPPVDPTSPPVDPTQAPTMPPVDPTSQPTIPPTAQPTMPPMPVDPKRCLTCLTTCGPCQACVGGPQGSFIFGSCEKCWKCWDMDDDKKKDEDEECYALNKHHDWGDDKVQCLSNDQQDCRACWTGPTNDLSIIV